MGDNEYSRDLGRFRLLVEDALAHLYQQTYLQVHPLTGLSGLTGTDETRGHGLQRVLLGLIQDLRPSADVSYDSLAWRKYRYLYLRYVEALSPSETASDLGVSVRQARRYWHEGIDALASVLWDRTRDSRAGGPSRDAADSSAADLTVAAVPAEASDDATGDNLIEQEAARLGSGGAESVTRVGDVVASVLDTIRPLASRRGRGLVANVPPDLPAVAVERAVLRQVMLGLLALELDRCSDTAAGGALALRADNAVESVRVRISAEPRPAARSADSTDHAAVSRDQRLVVARRLLAACGGRVESVEGPSDPTGITVVLPPVRPRTILVVEDNPDAISLFRRYLAGTAYRVVAAPSSRDAYDLAVVERPAAITLDVMMPGQDGWEVLQTLKSRVETRDIPVIVCSVLKETDLAALLGAAAFVAKPVSRQQLLDALGSVLSATGAAPTTGA